MHVQFHLSNFSYRKVKFQKKYFAENQDGFTVIELILVIAIISLISFLSVPFLSRFFNQNAVSDTTTQLTDNLRKAQTYSMTGRRNTQWGVYYGSNTITLYAGSSYATRNTTFDESFSVPTTITTGTGEINFSRATGTPSATTSITISGGGNTRTITINADGVISN